LFSSAVEAWRANPDIFLRVNIAPAHRGDRGENPRNMRGIAERAFSRAAGAPLVLGNAVTLLLNGEKNYDAWENAIWGAEHSILFENYIISPDETGKRFRDALAEQAKAGVKVRVILDWLGSFRNFRRFWRPLIEAGGLVRYHNVPRFDSPLGWLSRDHRKTLVVDGSTGFVSGVCVSDTWLGDARRRVEPWRDTGVEIRGPACKDLVEAFADVWNENGEPIPPDELQGMPQPEPCGDTAVRVIATAPNLAGIYRLDLLIAAMAQKRLWLTDAYFAGLPAYVQALRAAARDGVDVRLLVPGGSDLPWVKPLTTAGYRPLLEAGVRVFEWNGSMLHAKTAVADGRWSRVGSTNLNLASWMTNWEMDLAIDDAEFSTQMEETYCADLERATEVVLRSRKRVRLKEAEPKRSRSGGGSLARATAGALRVGRAVGAAVTNRRVLGSTEAQTISWFAWLPLGLAIVAVFFPRVIAWPFAVVLMFLSLSICLRAFRLRQAGKTRRTKDETTAV
jgi:cardiolipin synthase